MRALRALGMALLMIGISATVLGALNGDIQVGLALFFIPYLQSSTWPGALAVLLVFGGIATLVLDVMHPGMGEMQPVEGAGPESSGDRPRREVGGVVLIGPVPIVFGSSNRAALIALIVCAFVVIALMLALLIL